MNKAERERLERMSTANLRKHLRHEIKAVRQMAYAILLKRKQKSHAN